MYVLRMIELCATTIDVVRPGAAWLLLLLWAWLRSRQALYTMSLV
jgi:hypothetical protein